MLYEPLPRNRCFTCNEIKPWTREYFCWQKRQGIVPRCRECDKRRHDIYNLAHADKNRAYNVKRYRDNRQYFLEANRRWALTHHEQRNEINRSSRDKNKEFYNAKARESYRRDPSKRKDSSKRSRLKNLPKIRQQRRIYEATHREQINSRRRAKYAQNPTMFRTNQDRRRARKHGLPATFNERQWQSCLKYWNYRCAYCGNQQGLFRVNKLTLDHFIPISAPNCPGTVPENIVPACHSCNASKHNYNAKEWLIDKVGKRKAQHILSAIRAYFAQIG